MANIKIYKSPIIHYHTPVLAVSDILASEIFDLEEVFQGHKVQHLEWRQSMANIKIYKCIFFIFAKIRPMIMKLTQYAETDKWINPWLWRNLTDLTYIYGFIYIYRIYIYIYI